MLLSFQSKIEAWTLPTRLKKEKRVAQEDQENMTFKS